MILFDSNGHVIDWDDHGGPFTMWVLMNGGKKYTIEFRNYDSSTTIKYTKTNPVTLGSTALVLKSNGYSPTWLQGFDFNVTTEGNYSFHFTCPANCSYGFDLWKGTTYDDSSSDYITEVLHSPALTAEEFHTALTALEPGSYHICMGMHNLGSISDTYTIAMDNSDGSTVGMSEGTNYSSTLKTNDTMTTNFFTPSKTGNYKLTCDRSDAKITVESEDGETTGDCLYTNVSSNAVENLTAGTKYYLYYVTNGTSGTIHYSVNFVPSQECELISAAGFTFDGHVAYATASSAATISPTISDKATWDLYSDKGCTSAISHTLSAEGLNHAYLKVTAEDGIHSAVYPVLFYLTSASVNPSIVAYDPDYNEISDGSIVKTAVNLFFLGKSALSAKLNGGDLTISGSNNVSAEGDYSIGLTDGNSNSATFDFAIDQTKPVITAASGGNPITAGQLCNKDVTVTVSDDHPGTNTAKNGTHDYPWPAGGTFTEDGSYVITATDAAGNAQTFSFTLDKTAPVITAIPYKGKALSGGEYIKCSYITVTVSGNTTVSATLNGASVNKWPSNNKFTASGTYVITASDTAGNVSTLTFTIDNSAPVITAKTTKTIKNNGSTNQTPVTVTVSDTNVDNSSVTIKINGTDNALTSGDTFKDEGTYVVTAKDKSGNISTFTFTIDLAPVLTVTTDSGVTDVAGKITTKDVHVKYSDLFMKSKTLTQNGKKVTAWPTETTPGQFDIKDDGVYVITLQDKYGNKVTKTFTIDKAAPKITAKTSAGSSLADGCSTNKSYVTVTISDLTKLTTTVTKDGAPYAYPKSGKFSSTGSYFITAKDSAENTSTFTFTIYLGTLSISAADKDKNAVSDNGLSGSDVTVTIKGNSIPPTATKDTISYTYPSGGVFTEEGTYVVTATGYTSNTQTFTFTIDKTAPVLSACVSGDPGTAVGSGDVTKNSVQVSATDAVTDSGSLTFKVYKDTHMITAPAGMIFTDDGVYYITASDQAGNTSLPFAFTIDKTGPTITASNEDGALTNGYSNKEVTITLGSDAEIKSAYKGTDLIDPYPAGGKFSGAGVYIIKAYDSLNNETDYTFTIDTASPEISVSNYSNNNILVYGDYITDSAVISVSDDNIKDITITKDDADFYRYPRDAATWDASGSYMVTDDGKYDITVKDKAGNQSEFIFTIDTTKPTITVKDEDNNDVTGGAYVNKPVTVTVTDANLDSKTATIYDMPLDWPSGGTFYSDGSFEITATDKAGNTTDFKFVVDMTAPQIVAQYGDKPYIRVQDGDTVHSNGVSIYLYDDYGSTLIVKKDGEPYANWDVHSSYGLSQDGYYEITGSDMAGNVTSLSFTLITG